MNKKSDNGDDCIECVFKLLTKHFIIEDQYEMNYQRRGVHIESIMLRSG